MKTPSIPLKTLALLFALIAPQFLRAQTTVSGHVTLPNGTAPSNAKICFSLQNFKPNVPRVVGTGIIIQTASWCINLAANGSYSTSLWGNDVISPPGTYWRVDFLLNGVQQSSASYTVNASCTNVDTCTPLLVPSSGASNIIGAKTFVITQASSATTWNINHNFGNKSVEVQCYDPNANLLSPSNIALTDNNNTTITLGSPQTGSCIVMTAGNVALTNTLANALVTSPTTPQTLNTQPTLFQGPVTVQSASVLASINNGICLPSNCRSGTRISDSGADTVVVARCGIKDKDKCLWEPSLGLGVRYPSFHVLAFALRESNLPPGNRCHGIGVRPPRSPAGAAGSHSGVPNHREAGVRIAPESCWLVPAHAPKAESRSGCYSPPTADSVPSAPGSIPSTDPVGPSSKPEKTTTDRPAAVLHSVGSAPDNGDSLLPARDTSSSDAARSARSTTGSRFGSRLLATPAVRTLPRFLPG